MSLEINELEVSVEEEKILKGVNLEINTGEVHVIMGPNGSGKSTLSHALMGSPEYTIDSGNIRVDGEDVTGESPEERARKGLFLAFQYPSEISGITFSQFLREAVNARRDEPISGDEFRERLSEKLEILDMDDSFTDRYLNDGFSGGEKKRAEILQMAVLEPRYAVLDEIDSGLDIDALKIVADGINGFSGEENGILMITHYQRILDYIEPDRVHVMIDGKVVKSGGHELAQKLEEKGYDWVKKEQSS